MRNSSNRQHVLVESVSHDEIPCFGSVRGHSSGSASRSRSRPNRLSIYYALSLVLAIMPQVGLSEIIWEADFSEGDFSDAFPAAAESGSTKSNIQIWGTPPYGRPVQYGNQNEGGPGVPSHVGNGDLMWLTSESGDGPFKKGPRRADNDHSLALFVKSTQGGSTEAGDSDDNDCDGSNCSQRRSELRTWTAHWENRYIPYLSTRWMSISVHVPADFDPNDTGASGWGPVLFGYKMKSNASCCPGVMTLSVNRDSWGFTLRNHPDVNPTATLSGWSFIFNGRTDAGARPNPASEEDLFKFFPDVAASKAALGNLNIGGWTDFVIQANFDARSVAEGGSGFVNLWMRPEGGEWTHVVNFYATSTTVWTGETIDHGFAYKGTGPDAIYGHNITLYMDKNQVLPRTTNGLLFHYDEMRIGDENTRFADISVDGSDPNSVELARPLPPILSYE